jgi:putative membrane protein insertion efficiency factor
MWFFVDKNNPMRTIAISLIRFYQKFISPLLGPRCRFYPTCSEYAKIAFEKHNAAFACFLTAKRLLRCQPWCQGGYDPVPEKKYGTCLNHRH